MEGNQTRKGIESLKYSFEYYIGRKEEEHLEKGYFGLIVSSVTIESPPCSLCSCTLSERNFTCPNVILLLFFFFFQ